MKNILLASTALVAMSGAAFAQVTVGGSAEIGIWSGDNDPGSLPTDEVQFFTDMDLTFTGSGETDTGLAFGVTVDLDESDGPASGVFDGWLQGGETIFVSGAFGTLTWGDTDGALDWALTELDNGGSIDDSHTAHGGFSGGNEADGFYDGQIVRYDYSFGDFAFAGSVELDDTGVGAPVWGLGGKYSASFGGFDLGFGLGYQDYDFDSAWGVTVVMETASGFQAGIDYKDLGDTDAGGVGETHFGVGLGYVMGAFTFGANWGQYDEGANSQSGYGVAVDYDLGGGAEIQMGYGNTDSCGVYAGCFTGDTWSLGLSMAF